MQYYIEAMQYDKAAMRCHRKEMRHPIMAMQYPNCAWQHPQAVPDDASAANACHIAIPDRSGATTLHAGAVVQDASIAEEDSGKPRADPGAPMLYSKAGQDDPFALPQHSSAAKDRHWQMQGHPLMPLPYPTNPRADAFRVPRYCIL